MLTPISMRGPDLTTPQQTRQKWQAATVLKQGSQTYSAFPCNRVVEGPGALDRFSHDY